MLAVTVTVTLARHLVGEYGPEIGDRIAESRTEQPAGLVTELADVRQLQAAFNAGDGSPRLIMLLSPT